MQICDVKLLQKEQCIYAGNVILVWDDILTPLYIDDILTRGQYIVTIFWPPTRYFDPPPNST